MFKPYSCCLLLLKMGETCIVMINWYLVQCLFQLFMSELDNAIGMFLPQKSIKKHPTDRPWITSRIKLWIRKRQSSFSRHGKDSNAYRHCRNKTQVAIKTAKYHYYQKKVAEVEHVNSAKWWREIKKLAGQDAK